MSFEAAVHAQAIDISRMALEMTAAAGSGHPSTAMSLAHVTTVLMFHTMRWSPEHPDYPTSDRLVLSEGHAVPIVYAAAARLGVMIGRSPSERRPMTAEDAMTLRQAGSEIEGHPNPVEGFPLFDAATGSLGQGLSVGAGLAEAARLDQTDRRIYCIIGDGESREGQVAEALDYIVERQLTSTLPIFNCNGFGQTGRVSAQQSPETLARKLEAIGFEVQSIDGHAPNEIKAAFEAFISRQGQAGSAPLAIVARTVKGWGSATMQSGNWHGKPATGDQLEKVVTELNEKRSELASSLTSTDAFTIQPPSEAPEVPESTGELIGFDKAMQARDMESTYHTGRLATRKAYGLALQQLGLINPRVVALDADVSNSTFAEYFAKDAGLADRFFECRIAEQNMISLAVGLSAAGKIPFCSSFGKFITRGYDQLEMAILSGANIKVVGSHTGVSLAADGPSQMALPDVAWFRAWTTIVNHLGNPACYILQPADAFAAYALTGVMAEYEGACYMRTLRPDTEFLYNAETVFNLGGFEVLNEGRDVLICAAGYMVHEANKALEGLDRNGISATLVDLYSLPFDAEALLDLANQNGGYVITLEDNYGAGIGSAVADAITDSGDAFTLRQMHVGRVPTSARTPEQVLEMAGLSAPNIVNACLEILGVPV